MQQRTQNAMVGLFVLGGLSALAVLIVQFGEAGALFRTGYTVRAAFPSATGIREGTQVQLAGVTVGKVAEIRLQNNSDPSKGAYAILEIRHEYDVPSGSVAVLKNQLMGQPLIDIEPPLTFTTPLPRDGNAPLRGEVRNAMESLVRPQMLATLEKTTEQIGELASALTPAARALEDLLEQRTISEIESPEGRQRDLAANLYTAVERLHSVLKHMDTVLGDPNNQGNVKLTLDNFRVASEEARLAVAGFRKFGEQINQTAVKVDALTVKMDATVDTTHQHIDALGSQLAGVTKQLAELLESLNSAGHDLAEGEGTAGMLLRDTRLYDELTLTVQRLGIAASEMTVLIKQWQKQGLLGG